MASLRKKGKYWQIIYLDESGKQRERTTKETNKRAAELLLKDFVHKNTKPLYIPFNTSRITISSALDEYVKDRTVEDDISPATIRSYKKVINRFVKTVGDLQVNQVTVPVVKDFNVDLRNCGLTQSTFASYNNHLYALFNWLKKNEYYHFENPFSRRKAEEKEPQAFPPMKRLMLMARLKKDERMDQYMAIGLTYYFALRIQETTNLLVENFDFNQMVLHIKNQKGRREDTIPILDDANKFLQTITLPKSGKVFPNYKTREAINSWWMRLRRSYKEKYGMDIRYKFHSLRSARATDLLNSGHDLYFVKELMRHKSVSTTLKAYTKRKIELQRIEMNKKLKVNFNSGKNIGK